jgi:hypothetical protein
MTKQILARMYIANMSSGMFNSTQEQMPIPAPKHYLMPTNFDRDTYPNADK